MMRGKSLLFGGALLLCLAACSDDDGPDVLTSTVEGTVELASFTAGAPTGVDAIDEAGVRTNAPLAPDGAFKLTLQKNHTYELVVLFPGGELPIVHPRGPARIVKTFHLDDGNVVLALGVVRRLERAPDGGFTTAIATPTCAPGVAADPDDDDDDRGPAEKDADPAQPFALPDAAAPAIVGGCDD
ncbi:MAG: hypothetical protein KIT84_30795 [Labilithrix sp.]|nr:hypothetical protein [Labilithrix sp.]MCW5815456.1 hypothetical protein [Labilithrix sp.]